MGPDAPAHTAGAQGTSAGNLHAPTPHPTPMALAPALELPVGTGPTAFPLGAGGGLEAEEKVQPLVPASVIACDFGPREPT